MAKLPGRDSPNGSELETASKGGTQTVECGACRHPNPIDRKFCSACGKSLWNKCLQCASECGGGEAFCGNCGANQQELIATRHRDIESAVRKAQELRSVSDFGQAVAILRSLPDTEHAAIHAMLVEARQLATEISEERNRLAAEAEEAAQQAEQWLANYQYKEVIVRLQAIPQAFRAERIGRLLDTATAAYREIKELRTQIAAAVESRKLTQLAPQIDRYLTLQPSDEKIRTLAGRVRDQINAKVREALSTADYERAGQLLECNPLTGMDETSGQLQMQVRELQRLNADLRHSPHADLGLLAVAKKLHQLSPQDPKIPKLIAELQKRLKQGPPNPRSPLVPWAVTPQQIYLGRKVEWIGGFRRFRGANPAIEEGLQKHSGEFFVAAGLALQGIGQSHITINVMPAEEATGIFGRLSRRRKTVIKSAWGLDIGRSALKAIKIAVSEKSSDGAVILAYDHIPHRFNLAAPDAETQRAEIIRETLQVWRERHKPSEEEALCVNGPATRMLGRFFQVPAVKSAKIRELVTYETGQQIPYPLSDLTWGYQVLESENAVETDVAAARAVVVVAMRNGDARDQLQPFDELGLSVHTMQAEPIALHNLRIFEDAASKSESPATLAGYTAMLDIGSDASNLVISAANQLWFRTLRCGGNDINQALVREFKLTFAQAEQLKRQPEQAVKLGALLESLDTTLTKLVGEIQRSFAAFDKEQPNCTIERVLMCGGGVRQYGLLRHLIFGPPG